MSYESARLHVPMMNTGWTLAHEEPPTVARPSPDAFNALDDLNGVETRRPPVEVEPWSDNPTRIAPASYDSESLDAAALFADLDLGEGPETQPMTVPRPMTETLPMPEALPMTMTLPMPTTQAMPVAPRTAISANGAGLMLPPPAPVMIMAAPIHRRRDAATVRVRRTEPNRGKLVAVVICGSLALVAALVACFFYAGVPHRQPSTTAAAKATTRVPVAMAIMSATSLVTTSAPDRAIEVDERLAAIGE